MSTNISKKKRGDLLILTPWLIKTILLDILNGYLL